MRNARDIGTQRLRVCPAHVTGGKEKKREKEREKERKLAKQAEGGRERGSRIKYQRMGERRSSRIRGPGETAGVVRPPNAIARSRSRGNTVREKKKLRARARADERRAREGFLREEGEKVIAVAANTSAAAPPGH